MFSRKRVGDDAEVVAEQWLHKQGLRPLMRQYRGRLGEIDLVMRDRDTLVIIEVKYRQQGLGQALESVGAAKQKKLSLTAQRLYAEKPEWQSMSWRFDVLALAGALQAPEVKWIRSAFEMQGY